MRNQSGHLPPDRNVSYVASLRTDYVASANDSLLRVVHGSATYDEQVTQMGQVYASCLSFFVDKVSSRLNYGAS
ncbi:hypothetical protein MRX96_056845 [Rhipicephalus microplus]